LSDIVRKRSITKRVEIDGGSAEICENMSKNMNELFKLRNKRYITLREEKNW